MTKKTKIWIGVGAVALYLLWKNNKKKTVAVFLETEQAVDDAEGTVKDVLDGTVKTKSCSEKNDEWLKVQMMSRFSSSAEAEKTKAKILGDCFATQGNKGGKGGKYTIENTIYRR